MDMMTDISVAWFLIIFMGALVQGATGFGFALVSTPLLVPFIDEANKLIIFVLTLSFFLSGLMSWKLRKHADHELIKHMVGSSIVGGILGSFLLNYWESQDTAALIIAVFVIVFSLLVYFEISKPIDNEKLGGIVAGFFSGVFSTLTSFGGPPVVLLLSNQKKEPLIFKGTISLYFFIKGFFSVIILIIVTRVQPAFVFISIIFVPFIVLGWKSGSILANYVSVKYFRLIVLFIIIAAAIRIIINYFIN